MPTNVSTPIWRCDLCQNTHGDRLDLAERCESAPIPPTLDGMPYLVTRQDRFELVTLTDTGRVDTRVSPWSEVAGHHRVYSAPGRSDQRFTISDKNVGPALPGYVQFDISTGRHHVAAPIPVHLDVLRVAKALGLGAGNSAVQSVPVEHDRRHYRWDSTAVWVRPITAEVRAMFDLLGAHLPSPRFNQHAQAIARTNYLLRVAGGDIHRAAMLMRTRDMAEVDAEITDLQTRWFAGENVEAPKPYIETRSALTASKITKRIRPITDATGVAWEPRTSSSDYANTVTRKTLMTTTSAVTRAFGPARIVAVGGVKGGVGKSTTAAALSRALAAAGRRTVLIDLDLDDPTLGVLFDLGPGVPVNEDRTGIRPVEVAPNLRVFSHAQIPDGVLPARWSDAEASDWVRFLAETIDLPDVDVVVLDLPSGQGATVDAVLTSRGVMTADVLVAVGSADPLGRASLAASLVLQMHETRTNIVVENLGRVVGTDTNGAVTEIRPHGPAALVETIAETNRATYGGSLPYATSAADLADSVEIRHLAGLVVDPSLPLRRG